MLLECACNLLFSSNKMWSPCKKFLNFCLFYLTVCCLEYPKTETFLRCITHLVPAFSRRLLLFLLNENLTSNRHIWSITKQFNRLNLKMTKPDFGFMYQVLCQDIIKRKDNNTSTICLTEEIKQRNANLRRS